MKRFLAFFLALIMLFSSMPTEALATAMSNTENTQTSANTENSLTFTNTENGLTFSLPNAKAASDDGIQTAAEQTGLPVHFFVTTLSEAQNAYNGEYKRYKESSWGKQDGSGGIYAISNIKEDANWSTINSQTGIRAHMTESDIIKYVAAWPDDGADSFRKFAGTSFTIDGTTYSGDKYEVQWVSICARNDSYGWLNWQHCGCGAKYDHIHIDGILTQKVELQPQTLKLTKEIPNALTKDQTFRFKLYPLALDNNYKPTDQIVGSSVADFTATIPAGQKTADITLADSKAVVTSGYYKLVEETPIGWKQSSVKIGNTTGSALYIQVLDSQSGNNTVKYSRSANTGYTAATSATIYNEQLPTRDITVTKKWEDANNQDGLRPSSVTVHLLINNTHYGTTQTLSAANNWTATWKDIPYSTNYSYHVEEAIPEGYTCSTTGNATNGFTLTNTHVPATTTIYARKHWDDDNNRDGRRPTSVSLQLYSNNTATGNPVTVNAGSNWQASWTNLPVKANGQNITYTVRETSVPEHYINGPIQINNQTVTYPSYSTDNGVLVVTNKKILETTSLSITKVWDDSNDQDDVRPDSITLNLFTNGTALPGANGKPVSLTVTPGAAEEKDRLVFSDMPKTSSGIAVPLSAEFEKVSDNQWNIEIHGLLKHVSGGARKEIPYTVRESAVEGYTTTYTEPTNNSNQWTITNTHIPETVEIPVSKVWVDDDNRDGIRPASITVSVKNGNTVVDTIELSAANNWAGKSDPLPKYANRMPITYTVEETSNITGYTAKVSGSMDTGFIITNTHKSAVIQITVTKKWDDLNNNDGSRPYAVEVELRQSGVTVANAKLKGIDTATGVALSHTWTQTADGKPLYRYNNGVPITYTVEEVGHYTEEDPNTLVKRIPDGYSVTHHYSTKNPELFEEVTADHLQALVVNKYTPAVTSLNIQKTWVDDDNRDGKRPDSLVFEVWRTTTKPAADDKGISTVVPSTAGGWEKVTTTTMTPGAEGRWLDITVNNLPKYKASARYYYGVTEDVPEGYAATYALNLNRDVVTVTNTHALETTNITVVKKWEDNSNQDGIRPDGVVMTLYSGGTKLKDADGKAVTLTITKTGATISAPVKTPTGVLVPLTAGNVSVSQDGNQWSATISGLLKYAYDKEGVLSVYSVEETGFIDSGDPESRAIPGYTASGIGNAANNYTITNTHITETVEIPVVKKWDDADNQDGKRPSGISLSLQKKTAASQEWTEVTGKILTLSAAGNWTGKFTALPKYENGTQIQYKVVEESVTDYTLVTENTVWTAGSTVTLTNRHIPETTTVTAKKIWDDSNNVDGKRPASVSFHLLNDKGHMGTVYKADLSETAEGTSPAGNTGVSLEYSKDANGNWTVSWKNLPKYNSGEEIYYRVEEEAVGENYSVAYSRDNNGIISVTNSRAQDTTNVTALKLWDDDYNRDGLRPEAIQVTLKANDTAVAGKTAILTAQNHWKHTWENLPVNDANGKITYSVEETGYRIKNKTEMISGKHPEYTATVTMDKKTGELIILNVHELAKTSITVHKQWVDTNNQDGKRPNGVVMTLYSGGTPMMGTDNKPLTLTIRKNPNTADDEATFDASISAYVKTPTGLSVGLTAGDVSVTEDGNKWSVTISGLLQYASDAEGVESVYSVVETGYVDENGNVKSGPIPSYTATALGNAANNYTITNTHTPETVEIPVVKTWDDEENQDGKRPSGISLSLQKKTAASQEWTEVTGKTLTLSAAGNWTGKFTALPKYENGAELQYQVVETSVPKGYTLVTESTVWTEGSTVTLTNRHIPETIDLKARKVWDDGENQDNKRPDRIVFHILADGQHLGDSHKKTLTADSNWSSVTWENLPKYKAGKEIVYAVREEPITGDANYVVSYSAIQNDEITVTNSRQTDTTNVIVRKAWDDDNNRDGLRPAEITVNLMQRADTDEWQPVNNNGEDVTVTLKAADNWTSTVTGLDLNHDGHRIEYSVVERTVPTGYINGTEEGTNNTYPAYHTDNGVLVVTNKHVIATRDITVTKQWDDNNNQDGKRPESITVRLYANGVYANRTVTITPDGNWTGTFEDVPVKVNGQEITYSIQEEAVEGYNMVDAGNNVITSVTVAGTETNVTIKNRHEPETVDIRIIKEWDDARNQDGKRPSEITVYAYNGNTQAGSAALRAADNWVGTITGLQKYAGGEEIQYVIKENAVTDYQMVDQTGKDAQVIASVTPVNGTATIINRHIPETINLTARKEWNDTDNADGKRPGSVTFHLLNDMGHMGEAYKAVLSETAANTSPVGDTGVSLEYGKDTNGNWTVTWKDLPKYSGGVEIDYVVQEEAVAEYTTSYTRSGNTVLVTNSRAQDTTDVTVNKLWDDDGNRDGMRPESIEAQLMADGAAVVGKTATLTAANHWKYTWTGLPKNKFVNGASTAIEYTVTETALAKNLGYEDPTYAQEHTGWFITNSRALEAKTFTITKVWNDNNNQDNKRPASITFHLLYDGVPMPDKDGNPITLTVAPGTDNVAVFSAEAAVTSTGVVVPLTATIVVRESNTENDQWIITIPNLLKHVSGKIRDEIAYSATEAAVTDYTTAYSTAESTVSGAGISNHLVVTNTHEPEMITIPVTKKWIDDSNRDGIRPESVTVSLKRNGKILQTIDLNVANNWSNTFDPVPRYEDRVDVSTTYTVEETAYRMADWEFDKVMETPGVIPAYNGRFTGYTAAVTGSANTGFIVTNTHNVDTVKVSVTNQWDDYENNDGMRPHSVEVELRKNGVTINRAELAGTAAEDHHPLHYTWDKDLQGKPLYRYEAGVIVTYTVVETGHRNTENAALNNTIPEDYSVDHFYSTQSPDKFTNVSANLIQALIVNQYTPKRTSLNIQKKWVDDYDREGKRPNSLTFQVWATIDETLLNKNAEGISTVVPGGDGWGKVTTVTMTRGADGQWWDITVPDLPMFHQGQPIYYAVTETNVPDGYTVGYSLNTNDDVVTVTNTHEIQKIDVSVSKVWEDDDNRDGKRPESVTVTLYANGIATSSTKTLSSSNNWSDVWTDLYAYYMGEKISYTVVETAVDGYEAGYATTTDTAGNMDVTITNTHTPETTTVKVSKVWDDDENRDRIRPESVKVSVKNGDTIVDTIELNAENFWTDTFKALPKYAENAVGQEISYTVVEAAVTGYTWAAAPAKDSDDNDIKNDWIITNTHTPETVTITANKVWDDGDDRDGKRPAEVIFHLLADNEHLGQSYALPANAENNWTVTWSGEKLYKYSAGEVIHYSVLEEVTTRKDGTETTSTSENTRKVEDYIPTYTQDPNNAYRWTVTNTYIPEETEVTVTKVWDDDNNRDGIRPDSVTVKLLADGKVVTKKDASGADVADTITLEKKNNWVSSWMHLPKNKDHGTPIVYTVEEINNPIETGYTVDVEDETDHGVANHFVLTNTHAPDTTGVSVRKIWNDDDNNDRKRPEGLIVQLYANGEPVAGTQVLLNDANEWAYTWNSTAGIPLYVNQTVWNETEQKYVTSTVRYTVLETGYVKDGQEYSGLPEGYVGSTTAEGDYSITLTNTRASEKITVSVWHIWEDDNNNDGIRPTSIPVTLTNGSQAQRSIPSTVTMRADQNWEHLWSGLQRYQGGVAIDYTIEELSVSGYTTTYSKQTDPATGNIKIIVTHTHANAVHNLAVSKVWNDNSNYEGLRPASVKAQIYKNGEAFGNEIVLSAANNWNEPITLPVYENGVAITWTVKEASIPRYYTVSYDQTTLTIINTIQSRYVPKTGDFNNLGIWVLLFGGFGTGAAAILLHDKKRKNK